MKITIKNKYLYISNDEKQIAYFEHFEKKEEKKTAISLATLDENGDEFLKKNNCTIQEIELYWFDEKVKKCKAMFVFEKFGTYSYLILINKQNMKTKTLEKCTCCVEYDENHEPVFCLCEEHRRQEELRLKKFYTNKKTPLEGGGSY